MKHSAFSSWCTWGARWPSPRLRLFIAKITAGRLNIRYYGSAATKRMGVGDLGEAEKFEGKQKRESELRASNEGN